MTSSPQDAEDLGPSTSSARPLSRRALLGGAGVLALSAGGGALLTGRTDGAGDTPYSTHGGGHGHGAAAAAPPVADPGPTPVGYGGGARPPATFTRADAEALAAPPPATRRSAAPRRLDLSVTEAPIEVADGVTVYAWRYGSRVPGPVIRATEGDRLLISMQNRTSHPHNLHLHGRHHPSMDGIEPIGPGDTFTYDIIAGPAGVHPYHCHTMPLTEHIGRGLYGAFIVDPAEGRPPANEFVLVLSGWDLDGDGQDELVTFNGIAGAYERHPITVPVGERVRLYVINMLENAPVASFHLHAQTFDVFRSGTSSVPDEHTDIVALTQGERVVLEFSLPERGRYMFHPHQTQLAMRGAMGWIAAV